MINKKAIALLLIFLGAGLGLKYLPGEKLNKKIKIAVSDDSSGIVLNYMIENKGFKGINLQNNFEAYPIKDCCTSTSQWALSTDLLDVAILCPDAAKTLIEKDNRFEILGACIYNSDIFVMNNSQKPKKIGVTQNRLYQQRLVKEEFGEECEIYPMITTALPYALKRGIVDGIVIDIARGLSINGIKKPTNIKGDNVSYVLVVRKTFKMDKRYKDFIEIFRTASEELNNPEILLQQLKSKNNKNFDRREVTEWVGLKTRFALITE